MIHFRIAPNRGNIMTAKTIEQEQTILREGAKIRRMLPCFYPFDDVQIWLIEREHLATFVRYMPLHTIPVDDVLFVSRWLKANK